MLSAVDFEPDISEAKYRALESALRKGELL
jgi:hypothetical protein